MPPSTTSISTQTVHADDALNTLPPSLGVELQDVAPALHVSTTFRYSRDPEQLKEVNEVDLTAVEGHIYSRETAPNATRAESILSSITGGRALVYSSGLASLFAVYTYFKPKRVSIGGGYHGAHGVIDIHTRLTGLKKLPLDCPAEDLGQGDILHLETPVNPTGEAYDIAYYAAKAHSRGALLLVDATFAPPPLLDPFAHGADIVMHSGTKYFGGHSDLLCGVLVVRNDEWWKGLWTDRMIMGNVIGNMEGWLTVRSLRTLELRVTRASRTAEKIVSWLANHPSDLIDQVFHASLQAEDLGPDSWLTKQMPKGFGPVFAVHFKTPDIARRFPSCLELFHHATSLGGVESLVEWRAMSDATVDKRLVRVSIGVEDAKDLMEDIERALGSLQGSVKE
ncbi:Uncharacterized trans-sulfuration enzyme [Saitozyma sp. JCM 24511]|nr:Uncharacterized trans-sulfuration enzyme [Saitozyma sp. JCM 24511]